MDTIHDLESAFRRAIARECITAAEANAHLARNGWHDLWDAFQHSGCGNWYAFRAALSGKPGHQNQLRKILALKPARISSTDH